MRMHDLPSRMVINTQFEKERDKMPENSSCSSAGSCSKSSCEGCSSNKGPQSFIVEQNKYSNIKHVIGVVSGKGGVGKSFVTSSLAVNMAKQGYKVGILDADITGPSIPKMFGAHEQVVGDENGNMIPFETPEGIKLISVNLLMDDEDAPVIWRVPVLGIVENFSYLKCPDCGREIKLFGESNIDETAKELGVEVLGKLPLDTSYAQTADKGEFYTIDNNYLDKAVEVLKNI